MSTTHDVTAILKELEELLGSPADGTLDPDVIEARARDIQRQLGRGEPYWIDTPLATCLLGARSAQTIETWAGIGLLRSRRLPDGRLQVQLMDVLYHRTLTEAM